MAEFRVYRIKDKHITDPPTIIEADADLVAIKKAKLLVDGCDVELWEGPRFVIGLPSKPTHPNCPTCDVPMWLVEV
jgi:hypothetical protein